VAGVENNRDAAPPEPLRSRENKLVAQVDIQHSATQHSRSRKSERIGQRRSRPQNIRGRLSQQVHDVKGKDRIVFGDQNASALQWVLPREGHLLSEDCATQHALCIA
jgi:hypothetical protein